MLLVSVHGEMSSLGMCQRRSQTIWEAIFSLLTPKIALDACDTVSQHIANIGLLIEGSRLSRGSDPEEGVACCRVACVVMHLTVNTALLRIDGEK